VPVVGPAPTVNDHVYGSPLTVSATTYVTPFCKGCLGTKITPPRLRRLLPRVGLVESIAQFSSDTPLPVIVWTGPSVVETLPPISTKTGSPVGTAYPGHAWSGSGVSLPPNVRSGSVEPLPGK